jgi:hypothetical protein
MIESINYRLRKISKIRGHFPNDDALVKLLYLGVKELGRTTPKAAAAARTTTGRSPSTSPTSCSPAGSATPDNITRSGPYTKNLTGPISRLL